MRWKIDIPLILWLRRRNTHKKKKKQRKRIAPECFVYVCCVSFVVSCCFFGRCVFSGDSGSQINPMNQKQPRNNLRLSAFHIHVPFLFICFFRASFSFVAKTRCKLNWDPNQQTTLLQCTYFCWILFCCFPAFSTGKNRCGATEPPQRNNNTTKNTEKIQKRNKTQIYKALLRDLFIIDYRCHCVPCLFPYCFFSVVCLFLCRFLFLCCFHFVFT